MKKEQGRFIVVEGLEGAGKSTALDTIAQVLKPQVKALILTREPGGTSVGEGIRRIIKEVRPNEPMDARAELLLFYAARVQLMEQVIRPALARGTWVLADRFELSTYAYQGGGRQLDESMIAHLSAFCLNQFTPDLTLFLDISPEKGMRRAKRRGALDRIEHEESSFFTAVYDSYHRHLKNTKHVIMIDASQPLKTVQSAIREALEAYLSGIHHVIPH